MLGDHIDVTEGIYPLHYACTLCKLLCSDGDNPSLRAQPTTYELNLLIGSTLQSMMTLPPIKLLI